MGAIAYILFPILILITAYGGSLITQADGSWYQSLILPDIAPSGEVIGVVWTIIFILFAIAMIAMWRKRKECVHRNWILFAFFINLLLNIFWSYLFFGLHLVSIAAIEAFLLAVSVGVLIALMYKFSRLAAWLLVPYLAWVLFATYLTIEIAKLNGA